MRSSTPALLVSMAVGLALCYRSGELPLILAGLLLYGVLAMRRIDLALLFVPLTAPLFLISAALPNTSAPELLLPPHEFAVLTAAAALLLGTLMSGLAHPPRDFTVSGSPRRIGTWLRVAARYAPEGLFLVAGVLGVFLAAPEAEAQRDALRAFRWFIVEPLIFSALLRLPAIDTRSRPDPNDPPGMQLIRVFTIGGAIVALAGLLQFIGYGWVVGTPTPTARFTSIAALAGGTWRATSVYGNPNNLGLYLGRVWPIAAMLALAGWQHGETPLMRRGAALGYGLCALLCLGGILISFSRGAWVGTSAALLVLALPYARRRFSRRLLPSIIVVGATLVGVGGLIFALRGGLLGGSTSVRLLFWREALVLIKQHPLGLGLDQFYYYHDPAYGRSQIDPVLAYTQERYARQPHNVVFELWLNLGPLGVLAIAGLLARAIRRARATLRHPPTAYAALLTHGALAALAAALVHGLVDTFYFWPDLAVTFWLLIALIETTAADS